MGNLNPELYTQYIWPGFITLTQLQFPWWAFPPSAALGDNWLAEYQGIKLEEAQSLAHDTSHAFGHLSFPFVPTSPVPYQVMPSVPWPQRRRWSPPGSRPVWPYWLHRSAGLVPRIDFPMNGSPGTVDGLIIIHVSVQVIRVILQFHLSCLPLGTMRERNSHYSLPKCWSLLLIC